MRCFVRSLYCGEAAQKTFSGKRPKGRGFKPSKHLYLMIGICGEHGGEPRLIEFCHKAGMNYVSCSPFRVPIARLAAAQAVIKEK